MDWGLACEKVGSLGGGAEEAAAAGRGEKGGDGGGERRERREGSRGQRAAGWEGVGPRVNSTNFKGFFAK
jgi:hypothetical protein